MERFLWNAVNVAYRVEKKSGNTSDFNLFYIFSSYFIFVEPFWLKQIQKRSNRKKKRAKSSKQIINTPLFIAANKFSYVQQVKMQLTLALSALITDFSLASQRPDSLNVRDG